jgi:hypothetical protein
MLVASIVALHGNSCKEASYSVHVTIAFITLIVLLEEIIIVVGTPIMNCHIMYTSDLW